MALKDKRKHALPVSSLSIHESLERIKTAQEEMRQEYKQEFNQRLVTVLTTTVGVVAGLFWQTAITDTIKNFIPVSGAWYYEIGVALLVTALLAGVLLWLTRSGTTAAGNSANKK
jgi:hypothetical protein